jgi:hypothetical protein
MSQTPWYKKASVQSGLVAGIVAMAGLVLSPIVQSRMAASQLKSDNDQLREEIRRKDSDLKDKGAELQLVETRFAPFKALALQQFTGTENERIAKLALQIGDIQKGLDVISNYQDVSKLNPDGSGELRAGSGVTITSPTIEAMQGCWTTTTAADSTASMTLVMTDASLTKMKHATETLPDFPFSYYGIALILKSRNDPSWRDYAEKAKEILEHTTQIKGHSTAHDECLAEMKRLLPVPVETRK